MTSRHDWNSVSIVGAYRRLIRTEDLFRIARSRPAVWWPLFRWTDSKIRVDALYGFLALVLLASPEHPLTGFRGAGKVGPGPELSLPAPRPPAPSSRSFADPATSRGLRGARRRSQGR